MKKIKQSILNLIKGYKLVVSVILLAIPMVSQAAVTLNFVQSDHLGTPRALSNSAGDTVWQLTQTPFGETTVNQDPDGDGNNVVANLRFPGQYYDQESETGYNWYRHYDPTLGRYTQSDPRGINLDFSDPLRQITMQMGIGVPDYSYIAGINHNYGYVNGNPVIYVDPTGEIPVIAFALAGALIGGVNGAIGALAQCSSASDVIIAAGLNGLLGGAFGALTPLLPSGILGGVLAGGGIGLGSNILGQTIAINTTGGNSTNFSPGSAILSLLGGGLGGGLGAAYNLPALAGLLAANTGTGLADAARSAVAPAFLGGNDTCRCQN